MSEQKTRRAVHPEGGLVIEHKPTETKMVAIQLITDEGAFICNMNEVDIAKVAARESGEFVILHHAIRLDAMFGDQYEIHKTKMMETGSIGFYRSFHRKTKRTTRIA